ncbi:MAG: hypothetical protein QHH26_08530 [Armatimonadota bacterium]|nr:hypothetical protein [Armatimonadota bacterium]
MLAFNLIGLCILAACFILDRHKTVRSVHRGLMMFWKIVPEMSVVLILISISLSVLTPAQLREWLSADTPAHFVLALAVGSVALIPGFVAFPLAGVLLKNGASITLVAGFLTTLLLVSQPHPQASPLYWTFSHNVSPSSKAWGAKGCSDCHAPNSQFFNSPVIVDPFDDKGRQKSVPMWQYCRISKDVIEVGS